MPMSMDLHKRQYPPSQRTSYTSFGEIRAFLASCKGSFSLPPVPASPWSLNPHPDVHIMVGVWAEGP